MIVYGRLNDKVQASAFWGRNPAHKKSYCCMEKHLTNTSVNLNNMLYILTFDEDRISRKVTKISIL